MNSFKSINHQNNAPYIALIENNVQNFSNLRAAEVMIPKTNIISVNINDAFSAIYRQFISSGHTRIPVHGESSDDILGFVHIKDVMIYIENQENFNIKSILRSVIYTSRFHHCKELLLKMQKTASHLAVVLDEYGGVEGIVFLDNLIEQIVGDIKDEHDKIEENLICRIGHKIYHIDAKASIMDVENELSIALSEEDGDYETFGGFIISYLDRVPDIGEKISIEREDRSIHIYIIDADPRKILLTKVINYSKLSDKDPSHQCDS
ncbi:MAG: CBS domain-containing protein [Proteobacteria bacterium]|nr:CBS domain-containing protein [Pseudomonadota bacterium]